MQRPSTTIRRAFCWFTVIVGCTGNGTALGEGTFDDKISPQYVIERIEIRGNDKTHAGVIRRELQIEPGMVLSVNDPRFVLSRFRVLSLGFFADVQLRLKRGSQRGHAVLVVDVVERGTIVITELFFGLSEATDAWGGLGLAEKNFLGYGVGLDGAFVLGSDPDVARAALQQAYWIRVAAPRITNKRLELSTSFLYLDGSEFFRRQNAEQSSDPADFLSIRYKRMGATVGAGFDLSRYSRFHIDFRGEAVESDVPPGAVRQLPDGTAEPIDFDIIRGDSQLFSFSLLVERDSRSDPVLPESGTYFSIGADVSSRGIGSSYDFLKLTSSYRRYFRLRWGHVFSVQLFGGAVFGDAPFFEKFFVGDLNDLVPSRVMGLNFSTLPSRDIFNTSIDSKRYEELAVRTAVEYSIPLFRRERGWFYAGDAFVNTGLILLTSKRELRVRDRGAGSSIPIDLSFDLGVRLDTRIGLFRLSLGNALGRIPF